MTVRHAVLACLLVTALQLLRFSDVAYAVDDAWISFRIARNLLDHGVLSYDLTRPPVEGMTNLLWTLLSAAWVGLDINPLGPARALGAACHLLTVVLAARLAGRVAREQGGLDGPAALVAGGIVGGSGFLAYYAMSGLETPLWTLLFVAALDRAHASRDGQAGVLLGLLAMTRPEGVLVGVVLSGALLAARRPKAFLPFVALVAGMEAFRWLTYGALVPNTFHAKGPDPAAGLIYVGTFTVYGLGVLGPVLALPLLRRSGAARVVAVLVLLLLAGTAWTGGDWMPGFRRCSLAVVALAVLSGVGFSLSRPGPVRLVLPLAWGTALFLAGFTGRDSARFDLTAMAQLGQRAGATPGIERVALVDIGAFGWHFEGSVLDVIGLTDAHIGRLSGSHANKPWDEEYFRTAHPDMLVVRSETPITDPMTVQPIIGRPERGMLLSVLDHGGYRFHGVVRLAADKYLLLLFRDDLEVPVDLWGSPSPKDLPELLGP